MLIISTGIFHIDFDRTAFGQTSLNLQSDLKRTCEIMMFVAQSILISEETCLQLDCFHGFRKSPGFCGIWSWFGQMTKLHCNAPTLSSQLLERLLHWSSKQSPLSCSALKMLLHKPATSQLAGLSCLSSHEMCTCMGKRGTSGRPSLSPVTSKRSWNWNSSLAWMSSDPKERNIFPFSLQTSLSTKQPLPKLTCRYYKDTMETRNNVDAY